MRTTRFWNKWNRQTSKAWRKYLTVNTPLYHGGQFIGEVPRENNKYFICHNKLYQVHLAIIGQTHKTLIGMGSDYNSKQNNRK
jgi:hypothetical protein